MNEILNIFNDAQQTITSHKTGVKKLLQILNNKSTNNENISYILQLIDKTLVIAKKDTSLDKITTFICEFLSNLYVIDDLFTKSIKYLLQRTIVIDKTIRYRSCMILSETLINMSSDAEISDDLWNELISILIPRLKDKNINVRLYSIKALGRLQNAEDLNDIVMNELIRVMTTESSAPLRQTALETIQITSITFPLIVNRIKDINVDVRLKVIQRLYKDVHIRHLNSKMRDDIIAYGLNDREDIIRSETLLLIMKWIEQVDNNIPKLLNNINLYKSEKEAQALVYIIIDSIENNKINNNTIKKLIYEQKINWEGSFNSMNASEVFWIYSRIYYYKTNRSSIIYNQIYNNILPDYIILCNLINDCNYDDLIDNSNQLLCMKYLLQLVKYIDKSDIIDSMNLRSISLTMLSNINVSDDLINQLLDVWIDTYTIRSMNDVIDYTIELLKSFNNSIDSSSDITADDLTIYQSMRSLHITIWFFTYLISNYTNKINLSDEVTNIFVSNIINQLQKPVVELRLLSVKCLGLLCMISTNVSDSYSNILYSVLTNELEEYNVRSIALQSVIDYILIYKQYNKIYELSNSLIVILNNKNIDTDFYNLTIYSCVKLLYGNIVTNHRLMNELLKKFFLYDMIDKSTDEDSNDSKTHQLLGLYVQSVFIDGNKQIDMVVDCLSDFIYDLIMLVKDHSLDITAIETSVKKILMLSDNIQKTTVDKENTTSCRISFKFRGLISMCLCKEILKLNNNKEDKIIMKEFVKLICSISPDSWIVKAMKSQMDMITSCTVKSIVILDKITQKLFDKYIKLCDEIFQSNDSSESYTFDLFELTPGLVDLITMSQEYTEDDNVSEKSVLTVSKPLKSITTKKIDDENSNNTTTNTSKTTGRSSKLVANKKIALQLVSENVCNELVSTEELEEI